MYPDSQQLQLFDKTSITRGRSFFIELIWYATKRIFFTSSIPWPTRLKTLILRLFGAQVSSGLVIKPKVNIHMPWNLEIGKNVWIGEEVFILNFEKVIIGDNCCISQRVFLCTGNHDYRRKSFPYINKSVIIGHGCWISAMAFVSPGTIIEPDTVISPGLSVSGRLLGNTIYISVHPLITKERFSSKNDYT